MANEKRLIDANALKKAIWNTDCDVYEFCEGRVTEMGISRLKLDDVIDDCPTVDAVEVVYGRWEKASETMPIYRCAVCKERNLFKNGYNVLSNYCPNCGAKMDGGNEDA